MGRTVGGKLLFTWCMLLIFGPPVLAHSQAQPTSLAPATLQAIEQALQQGSPSQAVQLCDTALASHPANEKLWTLRGMALDQSSKPKEALTSYRHAIKLHPDFLPAVEGVAQIEFRLNDPHAIGTLRHLDLLHPGDPTTHAMLGVLEFRQKDCAKAVQDFASGAAVIASDREALNENGVCLTQLEKYDEAAANFQQVLALAPDNADARYNLSLAQWRSGHLQHALQTLDPLVASDSSQSEVLNMAAQIHESLGETPKAVELLRTAILRQPTNIENYVDFATLCYKYRSYQVGIDMINAGLTKLPNASELYLTRGILYSQLDSYSNAMADFEKADHLSGSPSYADLAAGIAQSQRYNRQEAVKNFRTRVKLHPNDALALYLLADALDEDEPANDSPEFKEALSAAMQSEKLNPTYIAAYDLVARLYLQSGKIDLALKQSELALQHDPNDQEAIYRLIQIKRKTSPRAEVQALVKRLADVRQTQKTESEKHRVYLLQDDRQKAVEASPAASVLTK